MSDPSPFDDDDDDGPATPPPKRGRRPWWRWNIVTLFVALFVYAWVRELAALSPGATWLGVISLFFCWGVVPMLFVATPMTTFDPPENYRTETAPVLDEPHNEFHRAAARPRRLRPGEYRADLMLGVLRRFALFVMITGVAAMAVVTVYFVGEFGQSGAWMYRRPLMSIVQLLAFLAIPLSVTVVAGILYTLTVIAERLQKDPSER